MVMITKELTFELPKELSEPRVVKDFFTPDMYERVKQAVVDTKMGTNESTFHTMLARWEAPIQFDDDIEAHCLQKARELFNDDTLQKAYFFAVRYQIKDGCIPHLWEHTDQNGTQTTIDITVENTAEWGLLVEGQFFEQLPNDAIIFCGQQHMHARPPYPTDDPTKYTTVLFLHFTQPSHWIQSDKQGIYKYGQDGDIRFFNRNRYLALPDVPLNQPVCPCHNYASTLNLYDKIVGDYIDEPCETSDMSILEKKELAPGIMWYRFEKESARVLKGLIQNSMYNQWKPAEVWGSKGVEVQTQARAVSNYFLTGQEVNCHPLDPIRRVYESLDKGIVPFVTDFRGRYSIPEVISHHWVLLRYEKENHYHWHFDDAAQFPRVFSLSMFLNDDYDGGTLEFKEFDLKITPEAGTMVIFCSGFPYMHRVVPVTRGIRYAVVKWYEHPRVTS